MFKSIFRTCLCTALVLVCLRTTSVLAQNSDANINTAVRKLDHYLAEMREKTQVPGAAVAIVYKDQVVFLKGYGLRSLGSTAQVDPDTVFELASLSKPITSTIVASLIGTDGVGWDVPIVNLDPEFKLANAAASKQVTVREMLSHRSGLPTTGGDVLEDLGYTRPEVLEKLRLVPLAGEPGKTYNYSNFGFTEGAIAVAHKLRIPWENLADQQLYTKLGMTSTSSRFSDYANSPNRAAIHVQDCDAQEHCVFENRFVREADSESPAGGVSSSVRDLAKWLRLQLGDGSFDGQQIVSKAALDETRIAEICKSVPVLKPGEACPQGEYYGLGWGVGRTSWGAVMNSHSGAFLLGTATTIYMIPSEQIGIVVLTNGAPVGLPEAAALTFLDYFHYGEAKHDYLALFAPIFVELRKETQDASKNYSELKPPQNPSQGNALSSYTGKYFSPFYGTLEVELKRGQLILRLPPLGAYYELKHWDGGTFTYYFASENTGIGRRGVRFSGKQVVIENLAILNNGVFTKVE